MCNCLKERDAQDWLFRVSVSTPDCGCGWGELCPDGNVSAPKPKLSSLASIYWHMRIFGVPPSKIGVVDFNGNSLKKVSV